MTDISNLSTKCLIRWEKLYPSMQNRVFEPYCFKLGKRRAVPATIDLEKEIGEAFLFVDSAGLWCRFEISDSEKLLEYLHINDFETAWRPLVGVLDSAKSGRVEHVIEAEILQISCVPATLGYSKPQLLTA